MAETRFTLIPQFTIRWLLALTAAMAVVSLVIAQTVRGQAWAAGITMAMIVVVLAFATYAAVFGVVLAIAATIDKFRAGREERRSNPPTDSPPAKPPRLGATGAVVAALAVALGANLCWAVTGGVTTLPQTGPNALPNRSGLTVTFDTSWVDGFGYRPVRISVKSLVGPLAADRVLEFTFRPTQGYSASASVAVTELLEIPAGATTANMTMSVPQLSQWGLFTFETYEDGVLIKELSLPRESSFASWSGTNKEDGASPVTLVLSGSNSALPNAVMASGLQGEVLSVDGKSGEFNLTVPSGQVAMPGPATIGKSVSNFSELPTRWIDYSGFDLIISSLSDLQQLAQANPQQWQAIRKWQQSGGTIVVYGIGNRWEELSALEKVVGIPRAAASASAAGGNTVDTKALLRRGWRLPLMSVRANPLDQSASATVYNPDGSVELLQLNETNGDGTGAKPAADAAEQNGIDFGEADENSTTSQNGATTANGTATKESEAEQTRRQLLADFAPAGQAPFIMHKSGLGMIVAIRGDENFNGSKFPWPWFFNTLGAARWQWHQRWGVSLYQNNPDFRNFLIPGVGLAPVVEFQILITLFVIAIGPVNYYVLRRMGKLNLTVLVVPISAMAITGALLIYALVADGLSVRVRARSFTHIDQKTGEAICWTRLFYYAGLAPGNGLAFDGETAVMPLDEEAGSADETAPKTVDWTPAERENPKSGLVQKLPDGWLYSRTPTQLMTSRVRKSQARLDIQPAAAGSKADGPKVTNRLGSPIQVMLLVDENGAAFSAEKVGVDAAAQLKKVESQSDFLLAKVQPLLNENQPSMPDAMAGGVVGNYQSSRFRNRRWYGSTSSLATAPAMQNGILESSISTAQKQMMDNYFPRRTYFAIVDQSPEVQLGTPTAKPELGFHVIVGEW